MERFDTFSVAQKRSKERHRHAWLDLLTVCRRGCCSAVRLETSEAPVWCSRPGKFLENCTFSVHTGRLKRLGSEVRKDDGSHHRIDEFTVKE